MNCVQKTITYTFKGLIRYLFNKDIFARVVHDQSVLPLLSKLKGQILELGAGVHNYAFFATNCDKYIRSDFHVNNGDGRIRIDATNIEFADNSFDSIVCMSALEHIEDYNKVFSEIYRVLKPGGQLLLNVPWLFPYHGAPDDYYRFSPSALNKKLTTKYEIETFQAVGNFWLSQAVFLQRPKWSRKLYNKKTRFYDIFLRIIGTIFIIAGARVSKAQDDDNYALLYCLLCKKR